MTEAGSFASRVCVGQSNTSVKPVVLQRERVVLAVGPSKTAESFYGLAYWKASIAYSAVSSNRAAGPGGQQPSFSAVFPIFSAAIGRSSSLECCPRIPLAKQSGCPMSHF